jgi:Cu+-exporting ATPase
MLVNFSKKPATSETCFHCGEPCEDKIFSTDDKHQGKNDGKVFCCQGCVAVYESLNENQLCEYYNLNDKAGIKRNISQHIEQFLYLDLPNVQNQLFDFIDGKTAKITFFIPSIHCSSCIWLLEHLYKLNENIAFSQINFLKRQLFVTFDLKNLKLSELVALLASIGYEPKITLNDTEQTNDLQKDRIFNKENRRLIAQIAVAGFIFGNVMLLSFPEYFGFDSYSETNFKYIFNALNLLFSVPVVLFSAQDYIISAYKNIRKGLLHIDFPLALGILVLWFRSIFEIFSQTGAGYIDSMSGLIFFLLVGKWFQQRTYQTLRYDRDFKSYFPVAVMVKDENDKEIPTQLADLQVDNRIVIRNGELIPADSIFLRGQANIDYSFVTGESVPSKKVSGEIIYAGGRQIGEQIELEVIKPVSQSYLTQLWNNENNLVNNKDKTEENSLLQSILNRYFTLVLLLIASLSAFYWGFYIGEIGKAINAFTSVLIVACPCALSLGSQFALGTAMRMLAKYKFYLKNIRTVEKIAAIDTIVFDKTGTITENNMTEIRFIGYKNCKVVENITQEDSNQKDLIPQQANTKIDTQKQVITQNTTITELSENEIFGIFSLTKNSTHPLSVAITNYLKNVKLSNNNTLQDLLQSTKINGEIAFQEYAGQGIEGTVNGLHIKLGSRKFITGKNLECLLKPDCEHITDDKSTKVFVAINFIYKGYFNFENRYRKNTDKMMEELSKQKLDLHLISGDNDGEEQNLLRFFTNKNQLHFEQNPYDKLNFIKKLQAHSQNVMMVGDGLNDAGALKQSEVGVAVTENSAYFTPASDAILDATNLEKLPKFIAFCRHTLHIVRKSFAIALLYNLVGLYFAVQGALSPVIAAILMPVSSITIILFTTISCSQWNFERNKKIPTKIV